MTCTTPYLPHLFPEIKAHAGNSGNELADQLAKDAVNNNVICFNKVPKSEIIRQETQRSLAKWQKQWDISTKGQVTNDYFPDITERLIKKRVASNVPIVAIDVTTSGPLTVTCD